jgi:hypothetical protein
MSTHHDGDLPIADYDSLPAGALEHRIRSLGLDQLETLLQYEQRHADRVPVKELLTSRIGQLKSGSTPSPGGQAPAAPGASSSGSPVSPETAAEPMHPAPHGTQDQPGKPKSNRA